MLWCQPLQLKIRDRNLGVLIDYTPLVAATLKGFDDVVMILLRNGTVLWCATPQCCGSGRHSVPALLRFKARARSLVLACHPQGVDIG